MIQTDNQFCDLTPYGLLKVSGPDAKRLLQGQLTCHMDTLNPGEGSLCAHCNREGRIVSLFYLGQAYDAYYLIMPSSLIDITLAALKKYAVFYKVNLLDVSPEFTVVGYQGNEIDTSAWDMVIKLPCETTRYLLICTKAHYDTNLEKIKSSAREINETSWKCLNLHDGIPSIYAETTGQFLPHELNLPELGAISFDKGCYTGQEIIARMHYRGKLKTHLAHIQLPLQMSYPLGSDITLPSDQESIFEGTLVDSCQDEHHHHALIITRK